MPKTFDEISQAFEINTANQSNTFFRLNGIPIDKTSVYGSLTDAQNYANNSANAYAGQVIAVITDTDAQAYIITPTPQTGENYLRPIADLSKIEKQLEDLDEKIDNHQEVQLAHELGASEDTSYSIKVDSSDNLCIIKNNTEKNTTNSLVLGENTIKAQYSKTVKDGETEAITFPVSLISTLPVNAESKFSDIEELHTDMMAEGSARGAKVQKLFKDTKLITGLKCYDCPDFKQSESKSGIKFIIDRNGAGYIDYSNSVNSFFDVTYDPETIKIVRFGDFYFYIVHDETEEHKPIGALCIGRPEGVFAYDHTKTEAQNANYYASWRFFSTLTTNKEAEYKKNVGDATSAGTFIINNKLLQNDYHVDEYGQQWLPRVPEKSQYPMSPLPVLRFNPAQFDDSSNSIYKDCFLTNGLNADEFAATYSNWYWTTTGSTPASIYKLVKIEIEVETNVYEYRYYIIFTKNGVNGTEQIGRIESNQFTFNNYKYTISDDRTTITANELTKSKESIIDSFDLLKMFKGKDALISSVDEYALPSSSKNLWGSYWLASSDREKYDIRVGVFDPAETSYEYNDTDGNKTAERLNPAGNYCIGKLENFHPLRLPDDKDGNPVELYIRNATIKGFKTSMDWPNASAVAPRDCSLRSGTIWIQYIFAYPVTEEKPRLFYRVLFDGYVNPNEHPGLSSGIRYPWSPCYELTNNGVIDEAKKYTDEALANNHFELASATASSLGGIKTGYTSTGNTHAVQLDDNNAAFVEVPKQLYRYKLTIGGLKIGTDESSVQAANCIIISTQPLAQISIEALAVQSYADFYGYISNIVNILNTTASAFIVRGSFANTDFDTLQYENSTVITFTDTLINKSQIGTLKPEQAYFTLRET